MHAARFSTPPPRRLYEKAIERVGEVVTDRDGKKGFAVVVAEVPVEALWKARAPVDGPPFVRPDGSPLDTPPSPAR